jgi:hypothetical protein
MEQHYFTIQEANAAVQTIRPLMEEIQAIRSRILLRNPEVWPAMQRAAGNGGSAKLRKVVQHFERLDDLVHRILATGAEIKDLSNGLLDFRAWRQDHEVYLCWKHGEGEIGFWHEIDAGYAGRQPIATF